MWELTRWNWHAYAEHSERLERALEELVRADERQVWTHAITKIELEFFDVGVPSVLTRPLASCLVSAIRRVDGAKRTAILSFLAELICGRGEEDYSQQQREWLSLAHREVAMGLSELEFILETGDETDAEMCVHMLATLAAHIASLGPRIAYYFGRARNRVPAIAAHVDYYLHSGKHASLRAGSDDDDL